MKSVISAATTAVLIAGPVVADGKLYSPEDYAKAYVEIVDNADNGCWTNIGEVKTYAEDQMELMGFTVFPYPKDNEPRPVSDENGIVYVITVDGQRLYSGLCVGYIFGEFWARMINPNRGEEFLPNPIGYPLRPYTLWDTENFNNDVLDLVKANLIEWEKNGKENADDESNTTEAN